MPTTTARAPNSSGCLPQRPGGIVAEHERGACRPDPGSSTWIKIKNPAHSQAVGRHGQFTLFRHLSLDPTPMNSAAGGD
jgi:hypothetical protein